MEENPASLVLFFCFSEFKIHLYFICRADRDGGILFGLFFFTYRFI